MESEGDTRGEGRGSVTRWIAGLKAGDESAAAALLDRYFARLVAMADRRLRGRPGGDGEQAALDAFQSFLAGVARGRFPRLDDRDDLWRLLLVLTLRKAGEHAERLDRAKRGGGRVVEASALGAAGGDLDALAVDGPTPELAAILAEQLERRLGGLDPDLRRLASLRMEGFTIAEIAATIGKSEASVDRKLRRIRLAWLDEEGG